MSDFLWWPLVVLPIAGVMFGYFTVPNFGEGAGVPMSNGTRPATSWCMT
jgi:hypothetical protein